jgi:outer membrane protein assembly factor BamB
VDAAPVITGDKLLVASLDNFIYALSRASGNRLWKRRFDNRLTAAPLVEGDAAMVAPYRGDALAVFLNADGKRVNYYRLEKETEIVAVPVFTDSLLLISTDKGLLAATPSQPSDTRTNAVKKP